MATNQSLKNQLQKNDTKQVSASQLNLKGLLDTPTMRKKFNEVLNEKANGFTTSLLNLVNSDNSLSKADPMTVVTSAMVAATLDLPIDKNLGYAWIIAFYNGKTGRHEAQFQLGYKGYIQLAQRSGQYEALNVIEVYEGELKSWNRLTERFEFDPEGKESEQVIGYVGYFKLLNGFEKTVYWTKQEMEAHRIRFNKAKNKTELSGVWRSDYDAMAKKTILRNMLSKWGILSIEMQKAVTTDETVQTMDASTGEVKDVTPDIFEEEAEGADISPNIPMDPETGEVIYPEEAGQESLFDDRKIKPVN